MIGRQKRGDNKIRKAGLALAALFLAAAVFCCAGCGGRGNDAGGGPGGAAGGTGGDSDGRIKVVTAIFPEYDWAREVAGENCDVRMLIDNGVDVHSFQPSVKDIHEIQTADVFIYTGGESEEWVSDALKGAKKSAVIVKLIDLIGDRARQEEVKEGMEDDGHDHEEGHEDAGESHDHEETGREDHEHDHDGEAHDHEEDSDEGHDHEDTDHDDHDGHDAGADEHIWLSLRNAEVCVSGIAAALGTADPARASEYRKNSREYIKKLRALDERYEKALRKADGHTAVIADRFPFRYMFDDYEIEYFAAFPGCSAETEASFETIRFLSGKVDELGLKSVIVTESSDGRIAKAVIASTRSKDQDEVVLDSMQSRTMKDVRSGDTYIKVMEDDLKALRKSLETDVDCGSDPMDTQCD